MPVVAVAEDELIRDLLKVIEKNAVYRNGFVYLVQRRSK